MVNTTIILHYPGEVYWLKCHLDTQGVMFLLATNPSLVISLKLRPLFNL